MNIMMRLEHADWKRLLLPRLWENLRRKYSSMTQASKMAKIAVKALEDKKGEDIRIIDIRDVSILADYFIIANGNNASQVQAMVDSVEEELLKEGHECRQIEGYNTANWILMDYNDIIVHVFSREDRLFYDLERIWRDGKQIASIDEL
jgi:ribosome-associated protein